jgi:hypothetical protein
MKNAGRRSMMKTVAGLLTLKWLRHRGAKRQSGHSHR